MYNVLSVTQYMLSQCTAHMPYNVYCAKPNTVHSQHASQGLTQYTLTQCTAHMPHRS